MNKQLVLDLATRRSRQIDQLLDLLSSPLPFHCTVTFDVHLPAATMQAPGPTDAEALVLPDLSAGGSRAGVGAGVPHLHPGPEYDKVTLNGTRRRRVRNFTNAEVQEVRQLHREGYPVQRLAKKFKRDHETIRRLVAGLTYTNVPEQPTPETPK